MPLYRVGEFLKKRELAISPEIQNRPPNPFTMSIAKLFFDNFLSSTLDFDGPAGSIFILHADVGSPNCSWAIGALYPNKIDQTSIASDAVALILFEYRGDNATPIVTVQPLLHPANPLSATDHFQQAMAAVDSNIDITIRELDACLCAQPEPALAMLAYYNLSVTIWQKFRFNERKGASIDDDEYLWVRGCNICLRRALTIYENMPRVQQLEASTIQLHQGVKDSLSPTVFYGSYVYRHGQKEFRNVQGLPALRCLTEIDMPLDH